MQNQGETTGQAGREAIARAICQARQRAGVSDDADLGDYRSLVDLFDRAVGRYASLPAFSSLGHTLTFADLDRLTARFACWLQQETGLEPGDRLAIQMPNLIQYPVVLYGALRAGLVVVNINPLFSDRELEARLQSSGARALVVLANFADHAAAVVDRTGVEQVIVTELADLHPSPRRQLINWGARYLKRMVPRYRFRSSIRLTDILSGGDRNYQRQHPELDDMAVLQYTGGTTGSPKGAMLSHGNLVANALQCQSMFATYDFRQGAELTILPLPLYHIYSFTLATIMLNTGNHCVLLPNPRDLDSVIKALKDYPCTAFVGINTLFVALSNEPAFAQLDFSRLKVTLSGGMALTAGAAQQWEDLTGCEIYEGYGLTETSPVISVNPGTDNQLGTIGVAVPGTQVRILGENDVDLGLEEAGELCVQGPQVMKCYWNNPEETAQAMLPGGWLRTGDIALVRPDGYMKIVDRKKDMILVSGFNVYPNEVEDVFSQHPAVRECAAIGVPDEHSGEAVMLFVVPCRDSEELDIDALRSWARQHLTGYKIPRHIEVRAELPKSDVGKVLRRALRDEIMRQRQSEE